MLGTCFPGSLSPERGAPCSQSLCTLIVSLVRVGKSLRRLDLKPEGCLPSTAVNESCVDICHHTPESEAKEKHEQPLPASLCSSLGLASTLARSAPPEVGFELDLLQLGVD